MKLETNKKFNVEKKKLGLDLQQWKLKIMWTEAVMG